MRTLLAFFALFLLSCSARAACAKLYDGVNVAQNVAYRGSADEDWTMDIATPKAKSTTPRPAVLMIHGGGWSKGDKTLFESRENAPTNIRDLAELGFVAATMNYRTARAGRWPAPLVDAKCALRFLRAHARDYGIDPRRIALYGNSAGGHLALLTAMTANAPPLDAEAPYLDQHDDVQALIVESGPIDLVQQVERRPLARLIIRMMGGSPKGDLLPLYEDASPVHHVDAKLPPTLLMYGDDDRYVPIRQVDAFVAALKAKGDDVTYVRLPRAPHNPNTTERAPELPQIVNDFLKRTLAPRAR